MRKSRILSTILAIFLCLAVFCGCQCNEPKTFTVTFDGDGGVLVSGETVQTVKNASELIPPVFEKPGFAFDNWDLVLGVITEDTTVKALWYSGYKLVLGRRYYDEQHDEIVSIGYEKNRGDTVKISYGARMGRNGALIPEPLLGNTEDYEFLHWTYTYELNGTTGTVILDENTCFNDEFFTQLGFTEEQAFEMRGKTLQIAPVLKFDSDFSPAS